MTSMIFARWPKRFCTTDKESLTEPFAGMGDYFCVTHQYNHPNVCGDFACPFCYIGEPLLENVLEGRKDLQGVLGVGAIRKAIQNGTGDSKQ